jgi:hypothetical protein
VEETEAPASSTNSDAATDPPSPLDYLTIMGLVIAGTHYAVTIPKK